MRRQKTPNGTRIVFARVLIGGAADRTGALQKFALYLSLSLSLCVCVCVSLSLSLSLDLPVSLSLSLSLSAYLPSSCVSSSFTSIAHSFTCSTWKEKFRPSHRLAGPLTRLAIHPPLRMCSSALALRAWWVCPEKLERNRTTTRDRDMEERQRQRQRERRKWSEHRGAVQFYSNKYRPAKFSFFFPVVEKVIQRVHYEIKHVLAQAKTLEFMWHQEWGKL